MRSSSSERRLCSFLALFALFFSMGAASAQDGKGDKPDISDLFFANGKVADLRIEIAGKDLESLEKDPREYVRALVHEGDKVYTDVAVHLKGSKLGSFRSLDDKPSLTLNFDKYVDGQEFYGLDKVYLNNSVEDPTYMNEYLCSELFRQAGVPAPRVTHARIHLNGVERGVYVLKEGFDKAFLKHWFKKRDGNLYDGGSRDDVTKPLKRNSGDKGGNRSDLEALVAAAQEADPERCWERLQKVLDIDRFISFVATEVLTWHWDGYSMNKNNYRLYHDPVTDKFVFMPHGMDLMFEEADGAIFPPWEGLVAKAVISTTEGRRLYQKRLDELLKDIFKVETLMQRIDEAQARVRPVLDAIHVPAAEAHDKAVATLRDQIKARAEHLRESLKGQGTN